MGRCLLRTNHQSHCVLLFVYIVFKRPRNCYYAAATANICDTTTVDNTTTDACMGSRKRAYALYARRMFCRMCVWVCECECAVHEFVRSRDECCVYMAWHIMVCAGCSCCSCAVCVYICRSPYGMVLRVYVYACAPHLYGVCWVFFPIFRQRYRNGLALKRGKAFADEKFVCTTRKMAFD